MQQFPDIAVSTPITSLAAKRINTVESRALIVVTAIAFLLTGPAGCSKHVSEKKDEAGDEQRASPQLHDQDQETGRVGHAERGRWPHVEPSTGDIVEQFDDAVVFITISDALGEDVAVGTGCIIDKSGLIATNRHVIEDAISARVELRDGSKLPVVGVVAQDESHDLAIMQVDNLPDSSEQFELREPPPLRPGDPLIAIGHPMQFQFSVSDGILSAIRQTDQLPAIYQQGLHVNAATEWLQTTAAISNGSSGGPLLMRNGRLVGINTWVATGQNLGFAISVKHLIELSRKVDASPVPFPLPDSAVLVGPYAEGMWRDFNKSWQNLFFSTHSADSAESRLELLKRQNPIPTYVARCLEMIEAAKSDSEKVDALLLAHRIWTIAPNRMQRGARHFPRMYDIAAADLTNAPDIRRTVPLLGSGTYSRELADLLWKLFRSHSSENVRASAGMALVNSMQGDKNAPLHIPEVIEILQRLEYLYKDVEVAGRSVADEARERLIRLRTVTVGGRAQQLVGRNEVGETVRLSDHRGKVVVLDFWADWSPQCRATYDQKRHLVESLENEQFFLLGVNCDESPQRFAQLAESGTVTWANIYDGPTGNLARKWLVQDLPTTFVVDADGTIRYTISEVQQLEDAVHAVLEEPLVELADDLLPREATWRCYYGSQPPADNWMSPRFADEDWERGQGALGYGRWRVNTTVDFGDIDDKWLTGCFRTEFHVRDLAACEALLLQLHVDDGAVVYLNGEEVLRHNLAQTAGWAHPAMLPNDAKITLELDKKHLIAGRNVIAARVHQDDARSGDLVLDLSLSSRYPASQEICEAKSPQTRIRFCQFASEVRGENAGVDATLKALGEDRDFAVRVWATFARICRSKEPDAVEVPSALAERDAELLANLYPLNREIWRTVSVPGFSQDDYQRMVPLAHAVWRLTERTSSAGNMANTYAVALYRIAKFDEAIEYLNESISSQGENPLDLAYLAMAQHGLGRDGEAQNALTKAVAYREQADWAAQDEAAAAVDEAEQVLRSSSDGKEK